MKSLVVEQVPHMREGVTRETDWPDAAERQVASLFGEEAEPGNEDLVSCVPRAARPRWGGGGGGAQRLDACLWPAALPARQAG